MFLLILGVALWWGAHLFKRIAPHARAGMGQGGKGAVAAALILSVILMVIVIALTAFQFRYIERRVHYG